MLGRPIDARVVDCVERMVVPLTEEMEYVTLSYVWGPQPLVSSTPSAAKIDEIIQGSLPEKLPQYIEDGMEFVKGLKLRYLWVDRYCIQQVHATDKKFQIGQMSKIYGREYATICALGPHDNRGLPGVSQSRDSNHFSSHGGSSVVGKAASPARLKAYISQSSWSKRGWTFQEALLSRRCLFLTPEGVFLVCKEGCTSEGTICPPDDDASETVKIAPNSLFSNVGTSRSGPLNELVQAYQARSLKFDSDILSAFE
jgi:hypothetical protein